MNIQKAKEEIKNTVHAYFAKDEYGNYRIPELRQRPILLMGPPGIGKTQIMTQIARECNIGLVSYTITHHTRQSAVGLPFIRQEQFEDKSYSVTEYTMSEIICSIYQYMKQTGKKEGILFIDEINCVSETLAPTMLQFLQCKTFGNQSIPKGWMIVAAGNPPEYNKSVRDFDFVTLDRVRPMAIEADLDVFKGYARDREIHPFILSYLELRPQNFYKTENDIDGMQFVTARGWEDLSYIIRTYESLSLPVDEDLIHQYLQHREIAKDVSAYYDLYQKYQDKYDMNRILTGEVSTGVYEKLFHATFDERLSCVELLVSGLHHRILSALQEDRLTDDCFAFLKQYQKNVKAQTLEDNLYLTMLSELKAKLSGQETTGLLAPEEKQYQQKRIALLTTWTPDGIHHPKEAFLHAKAAFDCQVAQRNSAVKTASASLEYAFTFMEQAFAQGQEMVIFVTELAMDPILNRFITEHGCERYFKYHKTLLVGSRRATLLKELARDEIYSQASSYEF